MAQKRKPVWRKDRISKDVDPNTGRRLVTLPSVPGMTTGQRDAVFAFEAGAIGTTKAVIRMNKRQAGTLDVVVTHRLGLALAELEASDKPAYEAISGFYA